MYRGAGQYLRKKKDRTMANDSEAESVMMSRSA